MRLLRFARNDGETSVGLLRVSAPRNDLGEVIVYYTRSQPLLHCVNLLRQKRKVEEGRKRRVMVLKRPLSLLSPTFPSPKAWEH